MKARDLAALAALGIAGKMAYDKFGNPAPVAKRQMGEGLNMTNQGAYERANIPAADAADEYAGMPAYQGRSANRLADIEAEAGEAAMPAAQQRSRVDRSAELQSEFGPKAVANNGFKKIKATSSGSLSSTGGPSRYNRAADSNAAGAVETGAVESDYPMPRTAPRTDLDRLNEANGAASASARATDALAVGSRANQAAYLQAKQADQMAAAASPSARATDALAVSSRANQAAYKQAQLAKQAANAQAQARMLRQGSPMATARRNAGMPGYDEAGNPISMRGMAGQRGFDEAGNPMKRGGVVKMASGGLASSKMSKPSGASRGDGIAQRGRTRGKYL